MDLVKKYFPELSSDQIRTFEKYTSLFLDWNEKINLISRKDTTNFEQNHLLHALSIAKFMKFEPGTRIMDVGTGGGLPGLPLAIYYPQVQFKLVDSIAKKIKVVNELVKELGLKNVEASQQRMEEEQGQFDFILSRAVAPTSKLNGWLKSKISSANKHVRPNGYIFLKGGDLEQELQESKLENEVIALSDYFEEDFFQTKKIIYIPKA